MKFVCEGLDLSEALLKVSKACAGKTTIAVLECIKVSAYNDVITLLASDGELTIEKKIKAEVLEEGELCVPGKTFTDFINKLTGTSVIISTEGNSISIKYGDNSTSLQVLPASDFPVVDMDEGKEKFTLLNKQFKEIVARTTFCCAQDDSRPNLKGCLFDIKGDVMDVTALDGYRMAVYRCQTSTVDGDNKRIIFPARTMNEIAKMLESDDNELTIFVKPNRIMVKIGDTVIASRLYDGDFINHADITPTEFTTQIIVNKAELCESIDRASILIRGDKNSLIIFDIKNDGIRITSNSEVGNVLEKVRCELNGKELKIAMNAKYILEAVKALEYDEIKIGFNSAISPFVLTGIEEGDSYYLILPVRTNG